MIPQAVPDRSFTDADLDAAIAAITQPDRLQEAQEVVARAAPSLQRVLAAALAEGGWFDTAHEQAVRDATEEDDPSERARAVRTLLAEETRLGMLVGVAVGYELARELGEGESEGESESEGEGEGGTHSETNKED